MFLLKEYYTPAETIEIINNKLNPIPEMEIEHLVSIVEKEALYLYAQSNLGTFKVKEGFFTFLHESTARWRYKGAGLLLAHRLMSDHRENWNGVLPAPRYVASDNELKEIPVLWDAVFKRADIENFIKNTLAKKEEPTPPETKISRNRKAKPLLTSWLEHYKQKTNSTPATPEQLISYCIKNAPQGYSEISQDKQKIYWTEGGQSKSMQIRAFKDAFNSE